MQIKCHDKKLQFALANITAILFSIIGCINTKCTTDGLYEKIYCVSTAFFIMNLVVLLWNRWLYDDLIEEKYKQIIVYEVFQCFFTILLVCMVLIGLLNF